MQKGIIKATVLSVIFFVAVVIFSIMTNQVNEDLTTEMTDVSLPVLSLYSDEIEINELHGYTQEMDATFMRDTITPISDDRILPVKINTYMKTIDAISYEIRSLDAKRLVADAQIEDFKQVRGQICVDFQIQNLLEEGQEYLLIICLESDEEQIYYYTRIVEPEECHVTESLAFVKEFHNKTFNEESAGSLSIYLERATADNTTLHYTTLNSTLKQVSWADFGGERLTTATPSIKEITPTYNVISMEYVMTRVGEDGTSEYYNVQENYRVRYTAQRMYLLNFERTVNEIFRGETADIYDKYIQLGIRSEDIEYKSSDTGNIVAFVQEGELWSYNQSENTLAKVFSFRGYEGIDERENYGEHDIKIVSVDEAGSITYIVYGYMNRGIHEGKVGTAIYRYDSLANTNEEALFIASKQSYEVIKADLGQLMYVNEGGIFFIMLGESVYSIDLNTLEIKELITGLEEGQFAISESNRLFAWIEPANAMGSREISIVDLTTEQVETITGNAGEYLLPLGFLEEDFVYGAVKISDIEMDAAGKLVYPMFKVNIAGFTTGEAKILKTYEKEGYYISDIEIDGFTIYLNRIQHNGSTYVDVAQDMIMNREGDSYKVVNVQKTQDARKQAEIQLVLKKSGDEETPKLLTPKETILEEVREVTFDQSTLQSEYYVYAQGDVLLSTDDISEAVLVANEAMGVVVDKDLQYVWKRSRKTSQTAFKGMLVGDEDRNAGSIAQCINAMLEREEINISVNALLEQGEAPIEILSNTLRDTKVLDLTGCAIDELLYYISNGAPVFAMTGSEEAALIIGYDASHISIYDPVRGTIYRKNMEDADEMFANAGSIFFTYLK
ncbi:MAG: hypothetical protein IJZ23_02970 [Roseburia sp.]|nr:hypothetical protein [Roseburia sp.]